MSLLLAAAGYLDWAGARATAFVLVVVVMAGRERVCGHLWGRGRLFVPPLHLGHCRVFPGRAVVFWQGWSVLSVGDSGAALCLWPWHPESSRCESVIWEAVQGGARLVLGWDSGRA